MHISAGRKLPFFPLPAHWRAHAAAHPGSLLLETAAPSESDFTSYLFTAPQAMLTALAPVDFPATFQAIEKALARGLYVAGCMDYEAGYGFHQLPTPATGAALASFGVYAEPLRFDHRTGMVSSADCDRVEQGLRALNAEASITTPRLAITPEAYRGAFDEIQQMLAAGDSYQVNFTTAVEAELLSTPLALYETLLAQQPTSYAALCNFPGRIALSFSPELFFRISTTPTQRQIETRPMKGTAPRGDSPAEDVSRRDWLAGDLKNRAEHVMIVDLLRNDLGQVCLPGSVRASQLFHIERYPTLFQMTSTITGTLAPSMTLAAIVAALFPSGSITGAPKRRTMEIIHQLESRPRGIYTGAIGFFSPDGDACFSVPIRTLKLHENALRMGVGGGIVVDSTAPAELAECRLKAAFLTSAAQAPSLIETLLWNDGFPHLEAHVARLMRSSRALGISCDEDAVRSALLEAAAELPAGIPVRVRLLLHASGSIETTHQPLSGRANDLRVRIAAQRIDSTNPWLRYKTTRRAPYDREFARAVDDGFDECVFLNERNELAEGCISNLFLELDGCLNTPPLTSGALPGIGRQYILDTTPTARECVLTLDDLGRASSLFLCNAVRGLRSVADIVFE